MPAPAALPRPSRAAAAPRVAGHFGEFLQGRLGASGPLALVTVPCPALGVRMAEGAPAEPLPGRAAALLARLGLPAPATAPPLAAEMPPGGGAGSSTAALVVWARWAGWRGSPEALAAACVAVEGASDPLMFPDPGRLLFAPREGRVLRRLPPLPRLEIVGGFLGPGRPTDPADTDFPDIADLIAPFAAAAAAGDPARLSALAAESARRTLARRGPADDPTAALAAELGAAGWLIAHTGSARGLIYAPGQVPPGAEARLAAAGLGQVLRFGIGR